MKLRPLPVSAHSVVSHFILPAYTRNIPSTGIRHTAVLFWRDWFRQLAANAVDWDAVRYGFPARYGATRPPPPEDEETTTKAEVKEEVFAEGEAKEESKPDMRTRAAKRTGGGAYSLGMIAAQKRARGGG